MSDKTAAERNQQFFELYRLCLSYGRRYSRRGPDRDDLTQEGAVALLEAIDRHDPEHHGPFPAYAALYMKGRILRSAAQLRGWSFRAVSFDQPSDVDGTDDDSGESQAWDFTADPETPNPEILLDRAQQAELAKDRLDQALSELTGDERAVILTLCDQGSLAAFATAQHHEPAWATKLKLKALAKLAKKLEKRSQQRSQRRRRYPRRAPLVRRIQVRGSTPRLPDCRRSERRAVEGDRRIGC